MKTLRSLCQLVLLPVLLPLQLATLQLRIHTGRARTARSEGDRGALSIELALIVIAVVAIAGLVIGAVKGFGDTVKDKVPTAIPSGIPT